MEERRGRQLDEDQLIRSPSCK